MANTPKATNKAPTKAQIEGELKETKETLEATKVALQESLDLIKELKAQIGQQQPQVIVQSDRRSSTKIKCINLAHNPVNISTLPSGQGRVFTFNEYGQAHYIKYDDLLDIISSYPRTMESGMIYIADKDFCDEQGLYDDGATIYTKEVMDKIVYLRDDTDVDMLCNMSKELAESTVRKIAELYNKGEEMEPNKLAKIKEKTGYDIVQIAENIKILSAEEIEALTEE